MGTDCGLYSHGLDIAPASLTTIRDYDGDGKTDLAVYHEGSGVWSVFYSSTYTVGSMKFGDAGYTPVGGR